MPADEPARHHERDGEGVRLDFLETVGRLPGDWHAAQDAFVIEAELVPQREMAELMGGGEPLDANRPLVVTRTPGAGSPR